MTHDTGTGPEHDIERDVETVEGQLRHVREMVKVLMRGADYPLQVGGSVLRSLDWVEERFATPPMAVSEAMVEAGAQALHGNQWRSVQDQAQRCLTAELGVQEAPTDDDELFERIDDLVSDAVSDGMERTSFVALRSNPDASRLACDVAEIAVRRFWSSAEAAIRDAVQSAKAGADHDR